MESLIDKITETLTDLGFNVQVNSPDAYKSHYLHIRKGSERHPFILRLSDHNAICAKSMNDIEFICPVQYWDGSYVVNLSNEDVDIEEFFKNREEAENFATGFICGEVKRKF